MEQRQATFRAAVAGVLMSPAFQCHGASLGVSAHGDRVMPERKLVGSMDVVFDCRAPLG